MVGSCRKCDQCVNNLENYCSKSIFTYSSIDTDGTVTQGGYSNIMVADERFIVRWPQSFPLDRGAPLLCAGPPLTVPSVTTASTSRASTSVSSGSAASAT
ncbi:geraniol dehydrogenase 1 [Phtheirospermum japonicum]|uniref:Geraniol dehydrogenase 1 n=1 Tax=Phtheirospermum japonicum TaxID=374723 RepID=A0A830CV66_9LAMI|nr:geraniol dehydrogenase 1 [Phtheirospermum japonicum]